MLLWAVGCSTPNAPPQGVVITGPTLALVGDPISFSGSATDPDSSESPSFKWTLLKGENELEHRADASFTFTPSSPGDYIVVLRASDKHGASAAASQGVTVESWDQRDERFSNKMLGSWTGENAKWRAKFTFRTGGKLSARLESKQGGTGGWLMGMMNNDAGDMQGEWFVKRSVLTTHFSGVESPFWQSVFTLLGAFDANQIPVESTCPTIRHLCFLTIPTGSSSGSSVKSKLAGASRGGCIRSWMPIAMR
jgi:hypothetical protein